MLLAALLTLVLLATPGIAPAQELTGGGDWNELPLAEEPAPAISAAPAPGDEPPAPAEPGTPAETPVAAQGETQPAAARPTWTRLGGANRYETMARIVAEGFAKSDWAVVASGANYPDALAAAALAGARACPIILTQPTELTPEAKAQLQRLGVKRACLVGGEAALGEPVRAALSAINIQTTRIAGDDRVATSLAVLKELRAASASPTTVIVATGATYPDALSVGPWSYATKSPIVLAGANGLLSNEAVQAIKAAPQIKRILLVGGASAVSDDVQAQLGGGYEFVRLGGIDRYETSAKVAVWTIGTGALSWATPSIATGRNFPDALAGAALAGAKRSALLVADSASASTLTLLRNNAERVTSGYILGSPAALPISDPLAPSPYAALRQPSGAREFVAFGGYAPSAAAVARLATAKDDLRIHGYDLGFIAMDLATHKGIAYNCDALFYGASSIKGPYLASVVAARPEAVDVYRNDYEQTLFYSWDANYKNVLAVYGKDPLRAFCAETGARASIAESLPWANYSARDLALLWCRMYQLFGESVAGEKFGTLCERPNISTIHAALGGTYRTRSKAGYIAAGGPVYEGVNGNKPLWNVCDDGGIVYAANGPYVVAIMTNVEGNYSKLNPLTLAIDAAHAEM